MKLTDLQINDIDKPKLVELQYLYDSLLLGHESAEVLTDIGELEKYLTDKYNINFKDIKKY